MEKYPKTQDFCFLLAHAQTVCTRLYFFPSLKNRVLGMRLTLSYFLGLLNQHFQLPIPIILLCDKQLGLSQSLARFGRTMSSL